MAASLRSTSNIDRGAARICTGTLIDPSRVLTAVHCVYNHTPSTTFCQRQLAGRCIDRCAAESTVRLRSNCSEI
jgi:hypothetical protein